MSRPRVVLLRGHNVNVWDLRPLERLTGEYDLSVLLTGSNVHRVEGLGLPIVPVRTPRDALPPGRASGAAAYALGERYLGLRDLLAGADIVHSAEIGTWFSAQAAKLRERLGFKLVLTVWETLPWRDAYRWPRERGYRRAVLPRADLCLAATERARDALLLEGVAAGRVEVSPPGIDLERFAAAGAGGRRAAGSRCSSRRGGSCGRRATRTSCARWPRCARASGSRRIPGARAGRRRRAPRPGACAPTPASSASPTPCSSAPPCPTTRCPRSTRARRRSCSPRCRRRAGRSSSGWCWSRRRPPARP